MNNKIQAVICAAGLGNRLRPLTDNCPKPLISVGKKMIIEYMLDNFSDCGLKNIIITVGYKSEMIKQRLGSRYKNCRISYIENHEYAISDNLYSLWLGRNEVNEGMIFFNGDIIFHKNILDNIINFNHNGIVTDYDVKITEDAMKVRYKDNQLSQIGKKINETADGWAIGIYRLTQPATKEYFKIAGDIFNKEGTKKVSFVRPLEKLAKKNSITGVPTNKYRWAEIDDYQDYQVASKIINEITG